jgi:hypothetical protein
MDAVRNDAKPLRVFAIFGSLVSKNSLTSPQSEGHLAERRSNLRGLLSFVRFVSKSDIAAGKSME